MFPTYLETGTKLSGQTDVNVRSSQGTDMSFLKQTSVTKKPTFLYRPRHRVYNLTHTEDYVLSLTHILPFA